MAIHNVQPPSPAVPAAKPDENTEAEAQQAMRRLVTGAWVSQAIVVAAELSIADHLADGERSVNDLAVASGANPDALYRLLRALTCVGLFQEGHAGRTFRNTALSETLRSERPGSLRSLVRQMGIEILWQSWGNTLYSVRTGQSAFHRLAGQTLFDYIGTHPEAAEIVNDAMASLSEQEAPTVVDAYDFSAAATIVDVGGGHGLLLAEILAATPKARGILLELPHAAEGALRLFAERDLSSRVDVIVGNALEAVPTGGDIYLMKHIVHDWDDAHAIRFVSNCAAAMPADGKLLLIEMVLPPPNQPHFAKLLDLHMLVNYPGGRERTIEEFKRLYEAAGLQLTRINPTSGTTCVIEGTKFKT
ncbi:methyltransferase [Paludibacterium purpuratum]|uniref:Methyltransferase family protein n=1 Tax=Paludibacterium purpuratum TaxID=1144873 RepID=A0A4R7B630_9NEIS|nr:methyltransferase [Paludibacterium purpuratum]TDR80078.1 methyltransferase family protein [Paludibacterium purpuratum]